MGVLLKHYFQNSVIKIFDFLFPLSGLICRVGAQAEYTNGEDPAGYSVWVETRTLIINICAYVDPIMMFSPNASSVEHAILIRICNDLDLLENVMSEYHEKNEKTFLTFSAYVFFYCLVQHMQIFPGWASELGIEDLWSKAVFDFYLTKKKKKSFFSALPHIQQRSTSLTLASNLVLAKLLASEPTNGTLIELFYREAR